MVFKIVTSPSQSDLFNPFDFFGAGNDILHLMIPTPNKAVVRTMQGNDVVIVANVPSGNYGYKFFLGEGDDTLQGSSRADFYFDEGGNDQVNMGAGTDDVYAGPGNDTIDGGSHTGLLGDTIHFGTFHDSFENFTIVTQGVTLDLASTNPQNLGVYGVDTYLNFEDVWGASGNDHFSGTNSANDLRGMAGNDFLRGFGGDDFMMGGPGQDLLIGDAGADYLDVGQSFSAPFGFDGEADVVKYLRITDSNSDNYDEIFNFQNIAAGGIDKIDLSDIDANTNMSGNQAFQFVGTAGFTQPGGEVRLANFDGATLVMVDNDGDSAAEMVFLLHGSTGLVAGDFIL